MPGQHTVMLVLALWQVLVGVAMATVPSCKDNEYHYEFTECASDGGRWHVPVPHDPEHCSVTDKPPIRQKSCDSTCRSGQYLDVSTLKEECKPCAKGTYSLGGAVRYSNWTILPPEFDAYSVKSYDESMSNTNDDSSCNSTWIVDGSFLKTSGTSCIARLTYSTTIVREEGSLTFWYYYTEKSNIYFQTYVRNEQCQISKQANKESDAEEDDNMENDNQEDNGNYGGYTYLDPSSHYKIKNHTLELKRGKNLVVWEVEDYDPEGSTFANTVFIKRIEVKGVAFSSECAPCPAGRYADKEGTRWCKPCPENQISNEGSEKCTPCDEKKEYAPRGSHTCLLRKPCKKTDYYETSSACDKDNKYQTVYKWIEPKICSDVIKNAVKLPSPGPRMDCPPCNPGMYLNASQCLFCPPATFSDGKQPCQKCPAFTAPVLDQNFRWWRSKPPTMEYWCSSGDEHGCVTRDGWQLRGDYLDSGLGHTDDVKLYFEIATGGFTGERGLVSRVANTVGSVRIDFELDCDGSCVFTMYEKHEDQPMNVIIKWEGRYARQNYTYAVTSTTPGSYIWRFAKREQSYSRSESGRAIDYFKDRVKVYAVVITNTINGGAARCRECPVGLHESGCVECPGGHYVDTATKKCKACEEGTYLSNNTCVKCGPGLSSTKGSSRCYSSCHYHFKDGRHLDFTSLNGFHSVRTQNSFLSQGTAFFYEYHMNLCGLNAPPAHCHSNMSFSGTHATKKRYLNASICQMRIIPAKNNGPAFSTATAGIGHQLMGVYEEKPENLSLDIFRDEKLVNESLLFFDFLSHTTTPSCPNGRSAWIILRCDSDASGEGTVSFPPECHEGTCDGCQFLFLWRTKYACPICTEKYYNKIESGCVDRKKTIHYNWNTKPKRCINGVALPQLETIDCHDMTVHEAMKEFQILIGIVAFLITGIVASIVYLWYKNRVLKYKLYQRVAVTESYQPGELPEAPSCVADDDEDEEKVEFHRGENPGKRLFRKLKDISKKGDDDMKLSDSFEVDLS